MQPYVQIRARLLPAAVAALLVLGAASPVLAGDGKSALQLLPYDTSAIASVNVDRVKTTVVYADALKMVMGSTDIAAGVELMKKQAGFDIDKDVKTFVIGMPDGFDKSDDLIVIVEGTFDQAKLTEMALKAGKTEVEHKGVKYLTDSENEMLVLPDKLVIADPGLLTKVIDVHLAKARSVLANPAVMQLVSSGDTSLDAWMAMVVPTTIRGELAKQLGGTAIDGVMASVDVQNGLAARMLLTTPSKADATALSTTISGAVTQLKTDRTFQQLGLAGALNSVAVTQAKSTLELSFVLTATEFTILRQLLGAFI